MVYGGQRRRIRPFDDESSMFQVQIGNQKPDAQHYVSFCKWMLSKAP